MGRKDARELIHVLPQKVLDSACQGSGLQCSVNTLHHTPLLTRQTMRQQRGRVMNRNGFCLVEKSQNIEGEIH